MLRVTLEESVSEACWGKSAAVLWARRKMEGKSPPFQRLQINNYRFVMLPAVFNQNDRFSVFRNTSYLGAVLHWPAEQVRIGFQCKTTCVDCGASGVESRLGWSLALQRVALQTAINAFPKAAWKHPFVYHSDIVDKRGRFFFLVSIDRNGPITERDIEWLILHRWIVPELRTE